MGLTHIDLFSGIGGFALAAQWAGFRTVAFVEIEPYAQEIIKQNFGAVVDNAKELDGQHQAGTNKRQIQQSGIRNGARLFPDIRTFNGTAYRGATLLTGGFPCQPFSQAGKRRGKEDDRFIWPEMLRVIRESKPTWILAENVAGIVTMELDRVLSDLEGEGYAIQAFIIPACAVDAKHRRDRVWIVAYADCPDSEPGGSQRRGPEKTGPCDRVARPSEHAEHVAKSICDAGLRRSEGTGNKISRREQSARWEFEPNVGRVAVRLSDGLDDGQRFYSYEKEWEGIPRVATGVKNRVDRLKGLGNSIQPQVAYEILKAIAEIERG